MASFWTTDIIPVASAATAAISAGAAVVAAWLARETVKETREMRVDAKKAADDAAAQAKTQLEEQQRLAAEELANLQRLSDTELADRRRISKAEAAERRRVEAAEDLNRRIEQLETMSDLVLRIADVARDEARHPPERLDGALSGSSLPSMLMRLENAIATYCALGGDQPTLASLLAQKDRSLGVPAITVLGDANAALMEIQTLTLLVGSERVALPTADG